MFWCFHPQPKQDLPTTDPIIIFENGCFITQASEQRPVIIFGVYHTLCLHQGTEMHVKNVICLGGFIALWHITSWRDQNMILWRETEYLTRPPIREITLHKGRYFLWLLQRTAKPCCTWCNYPHFHYLLCLNYYYSMLGKSSLNSLQSQSLTTLFHSLDYKSSQRKLQRWCWFLSSYSPLSSHSWLHGQAYLLILNELPFN